MVQWIWIVMRYILDLIEDSIIGLTMMDLLFVVDMCLRRTFTITASTIFDLVQKICRPIVPVQILLGEYCASS
jgi:hypothetical protein